MWFNLPIFEENLIKINVCVLVCTLVAFARLLILVEVLAFFNFKKMTFCIVGPEIWSQNMIPFLNKIILEQNKKKGFLNPMKFLYTCSVSAFVILF